MALPGFVITTRASVYSFHAWRNANTDAVTMPGPSRGRVTRMKAPNRLQPSTIAASSRSAGMPWMKPRSSHTVKGTTVPM